MRSKAYQSIKEKAPTENVDLATAVSFLQHNNHCNFDATVEVHLHLGIDASKSDQTVRGSVMLPAGTVKRQQIVVFTADPDQQKELSKSVAQVGGEELINQVAQEGSLNADITIATPDLMPQVASIAKILGPKGLMPNPKTGTVTPNPAQAVKNLQSGQLSFKADQQGNVHAAVGKISWNQDKIISNLEAFIKAVKDARPAAAKGEFIHSISVKSTMGPAIRIAA